MRKIALIDLDAFYCSAEAIKNPQLKERPFAVGGQANSRGVIATANYTARQFGVRSAMPSSQAKRLCPQLTILPPDMSLYRDLSHQIETILNQYTDIVEKASIDEFYLDLTHNTLFNGSASRTVEAIRAEIATLGLTASAGISSIRMAAKIASEDKKPNGQTVIAPDQLYDWIGDLDLKRIPGIGPVTLQKLNQYGYFYGADIQQTTLSDIQQVVGSKHGAILFERCQGIDPRPIITEHERKSIGVEETLNSDFQQVEQGLTFLQQKLFDRLKQRMTVAGGINQTIKTQTVKLKFADFSLTTVSQRTDQLSLSLFEELLHTAWRRSELRGVRLIGISAALPGDDQQSMQLNLFDNAIN